MIKKTIDKLNSKLAKAGVPSIENFSPLDVLTNYNISAKPYAEIILKYAPALKPNEKEMAVRALTEKGMNQAVPFLLSLFDNYSPIDLDLWAVGNALYVINDESSYDAILSICNNQKYGQARQMLMGTLAKMRKSKKAYLALIACINDDTVRGHAIAALGRYGNVDVVPILKKIKVRKGLYESRAKLSTIRMLMKKKNKI